MEKNLQLWDSVLYTILFASFRQPLGLRLVCVQVHAKFVAGSSGAKAIPLYRFLTVTQIKLQMRAFGSTLEHCTHLQHSEMKSFWASTQYWIDIKHSTANLLLISPFLSTDLFSVLNTC